MKTDKNVCPKCKSEPIIKNMGLWTEVQCPDNQCPFSKEGHGVTANEAIKDWNKKTT